MLQYEADPIPYEIMAKRVTTVLRQHKEERIPSNSKIRNQERSAKSHPTTTRRETKNMHQKAEP
jgi:hypothetical protein